jgi:hypothetical protein
MRKLLVIGLVIGVLAAFVSFIPQASAQGCGGGCKGAPPGEEAKVNDDNKGQECPMKAFFENLPPEVQQRVKERFRQMPEERRARVIEMFRNLPPERRPEAAGKLMQRLQGEEKGPMPGRGKKVIVIREDDNEDIDVADFTFEDVDKANDDDGEFEDAGEDDEDDEEGENRERNIIIDQGWTEYHAFGRRFGEKNPARGEGVCGQCRGGMRGKGPAKGQCWCGHQGQCKGQCQCGMGQVMPGQGQCGMQRKGMTKGRMADGKGQCPCGMRGKGPAKGQMMNPQMGEDAMKSCIRQFAQKNPELAGRLREVFVKLSPEDKQVVVQAIREIKGQFAGCACQGQRGGCPGQGKCGGMCGGGQKEPGPQAFRGQCPGMQGFAPQGGPNSGCKCSMQAGMAPQDMKQPGNKKGPGKKGMGKKKHPQVI